MSFDADLGPINHLVVRFPTTPVPSGGLNHILGLVDAGRIVVLDAEFVVVSNDGPVVVPAEQVGAPAFAGAASGLIDDADLALVADALAAGEVGFVLVYEDLTLLPAIRVLVEEGAQLVSEGSVHLDELVAILDATEA